MDLSNATELIPLADVARDVLGVAEKAGAKVFIAGAISRDLWLWHGHKIRMVRATGDIDFAVQCRDWKQFDNLARELIESRFTVPNPKIQHRFRHSNRTLVDFVPFGGLERPDRTIAWPPDESHVMNLLGFEEVLATAVNFRLPGEVVVPVISLPSLAALKLLAWRDRGMEAPSKDASDLRVILENYSSVVDLEELFDAIPGLSERADFDFEEAGAELIGVELARYARGKFLATMKGLLQSEADPEGDLRLARAMKQGEEDRSRRFLGALFKGIQG
jgi:predicted nucleotidyltransferase